MDFRIEIADRSFNLLEYLEDEVSSVSWNFADIGGCGGFSFSLPRKYCDEKYISGDFNIKIKLRNDTTKTYDLVYQGIVQTKTPRVESRKEMIAVDGQGYFNQLSNIQISKSYTNKEISYMVKDILDTYIVGVKDITYSASDIENTGFTADSITFNTNVLDALKTLADIAGGRTWGVDKNRSFYMKAKATTPGFYFTLGDKIVGFSEDQDFTSVVNRLIVQGGDIAGTPYTATYNDTSSQLKFGRRDAIYQNSSIKTATVASQVATSIFADKSDVIRKASCSLIKHNSILESTIPMPLMVIRSAPAVTYGTKKYGTFLYSGLINRKINRIRYLIDSNRAFSISLDLGQYLPSQAEQLRQLEYKLEQLRSTGL